MKKLPATLSFLLFSAFVFSQNKIENDSLGLSLSVNDLSVVTVKAYRLKEQESEVPLAMSRVGHFRLERGEQLLTLNDALSTVPGVYVQNSENFAQDLRVAIRGFGARSAFGIRGVKIYQDGFPETTPDGTGQVDNIDPASVRSVEVIRGQTAGLYGNASGGYMNFTTLDFSGKERLHTGFRMGSFGFQKPYMRATGKVGRLNYSFFGSAMNREGYRDNSAVENYLFNTGFQLPFDSTLTLSVAVNFLHSPEAGEPGNLSFQDAEEAPRQARNPLWGETVTQARLGVFLEKKWGTRNSASFRGYRAERYFQNTLFDRINDLTRSFTGAQGIWSHNFGFQKIPWEFSLGMGLESQVDEREVFDENNGKKATRLDKRVEEFSNGYLFASTKMTFLDFFHLHFGIRYDHIDIGLENHLLEFIRQEIVQDKKTYKELNTMTGVSMSFDPRFSIYFNFSGAFETPTLRESISIFADSLDPKLSPQKAKTRELGMKSWSEKGNFKFDLALFHIQTEDEILLIETNESEFQYGNVGLTDRKGFEFSMGCRLAKDFYGYASYAYSSFLFKNNSDLSFFEWNDNHLPGIPEHYFWSELRYQPRLGFFGSAKFQRVGKQFADNENQVEVEPYWLVGFRAGFAWKNEKRKSEVFFGLNNLFDKFYFSNLRINDRFGRYYEPAPGRNFLAGLSFQFGR